MHVNHLPTIFSKDLFRDLVEHELRTGMFIKWHTAHRMKKLIQPSNFSDSNESNTSDNGRASSGSGNKSTESVNFSSAFSKAIRSQIFGSDGNGIGKSNSGNISQHSGGSGSSNNEHLQLHPSVASDSTLLRSAVGAATDIALQEKEVNRIVKLEKSLDSSMSTTSISMPMLSSSSSSSSIEIITTSLPIRQTRVFDFANNTTTNNNSRVSNNNAQQPNDDDELNNTLNVRVQPWLTISIHNKNKNATLIPCDAMARITTSNEFSKDNILFESGSSDGGLLKDLCSKGNFVMFI